MNEERQDRNHPGVSPQHHTDNMQPEGRAGLLREQDYINAARRLLSGVHTPWLLISIDVEKFKLFNEWYGWEAGSKVLSDIGSCLMEEADAAGGLAGYMGNDDFLLLVPEGSIDIDKLYKRIHAVIGQHGISLGFQPSFGISKTTGTDSEISFYTLMDQAAFSCEKAQNDFRKRIVYFDHNMLEKTEREYLLLSEFRQALNNNEISYFLQPQCRASTGKIVGAEALARWQKKDGSFVSPADFIPTLENTGFITDLDIYIWESVASWLRDFRLRGGAPIPVSVNISQVDIFTIDIPAFFRNLIKRYELPADAIKVEITESAAAGDAFKVLETVHELQDAGFSVLMDDFGSGYSSLNMLHKVDTDVIKIDALFLQFSGGNEEKGIQILESIVNMTKTMGTPVIVEGVEHEEQVHFLRTLGCRYMQGFYFYKPMPVTDFERLLSDPEKVDLSGFAFKANEQFHVREFLDESVYSDSMLNSILGPVAFYAWRGDDIDIVRFNEQFYESVNVPDFHQRLKSIQQYMPAEEAEKLKEALASAMIDRMNGAQILLPFYKENGSTARYLMHFYYLRSQGDTRLFYGSARDVTTITLLQQHMELIINSFSECLIFLTSYNNSYYLEVIAQGIPELGFSRKELEEELNSSKFYERIVPEHRERLHIQSMDVIQGIDFSSYFSVYTKRGKRLNLHIETDCLEDNTSNVRCIVKITQAVS